MLSVFQGKRFQASKDDRIWHDDERHSNTVAITHGMRLLRYPFAQSLRRQLPLSNQQSIVQSSSVDALVRMVLQEVLRDDVSDIYVIQQTRSHLHPVLSQLLSAKSSGYLHFTLAFSNDIDRRTHSLRIARNTARENGADATL